MARSADDLEDIIRGAVESTDAALLQRLSDPSMAELLTETFRGRHRRLAIAGAIVNLALFVGGLACGVQFLQAGDPRAMLLWGGGMLLCLGAVTAIKIWYWIEMSRLAVARDIKRLELQILQLAEKVTDREAG